MLKSRHQVHNVFTTSILQQLNSRRWSNIVSKLDSKITYILITTSTQNCNRNNFASASGRTRDVTIHGHVLTTFTTFPQGCETKLLDSQT